MGVPVTGWSARRLNHLIQTRGYRDYLEIGISRGLTFLEVQAPSMIAVDPQFRFDWQADRRPGVAYHAMTSDAYFAGPGKDAMYDAALVDGLHTFEQTLRDLLNVLPRMRRGGVVLIDDTIPTDMHSAMRSPEEAQVSRAAAGKVSGAWHGDVYKVVVFLHDYLTDWDFVTVRGRGGNSQTLVWHAPGRERKPLAERIAEIDNMSYESFSLLRTVLPEAAEDEGLARCLAALARQSP